LDTILAEVAQRDLQSAADSARVLDRQHQFLGEFTAVCQQVIRPAMQAVLERLERDGGGGAIREHPGGEPRFGSPSLILWMSLEGEIDGEPRPDRHPYLQLDANVSGGEVHVFEGDMWRGRGGNRSGRIGTWQLSDITADRVTTELLSIAHRSGS
jgi:hypothetical protein